MDRVQEFKDGKIWIHIAKEDASLIDQLAEALKGVDFCSGDALNSDVMYRAIDPEAWFRCENGVSYNHTYPRYSDCWNLAPDLYKHGEIVDIKDFLNVKDFEVTETEFCELFI